MAAKKSAKSSSSSEGVLVVAVNKQARRNFEILEKMEAGLSLLGSEVKALREGKANLKEAYVRPINSEVFLIGCHISHYSHAPVDSHDVVRQRKLLLHRGEIERIAQKVKLGGLTLVPLRLYFKNGRCKLEIALGRGKKLHDKREDVKSREAKIEMERAFRARS